MLNSCLTHMFRPISTQTHLHKHIHLLHTKNVYIKNLTVLVKLNKIRQKCILTYKIENIYEKIHFIFILYKYILLWFECSSDSYILNRFSQVDCQFKRLCKYLKMCPGWGKQGRIQTLRGQPNPASILLVVCPVRCLHHIIWRPQSLPAVLLCCNGMKSPRICELTCKFLSLASGVFPQPHK